MVAPPEVPSVALPPAGRPVVTLIRNVVLPCTIRISSLIGSKLIPTELPPPRGSDAIPILIALRVVVLEGTEVESAVMMAVSISRLYS